MSTESVTKSKRGGKREGAGRKPLSGYGTVVMRVPSCLKKYILSMIDIYVDWMNNDEMKKYIKTGRVWRWKDETISRKDAKRAAGKRHVSGRRALVWSALHSG